MSNGRLVCCAAAWSSARCGTGWRSCSRGPAAAAHQAPPTPVPRPVLGTASGHAVSPPVLQDYCIYIYILVIHRPLICGLRLQSCPLFLTHVSPLKASSKSEGSPLQRPENVPKKQDARPTRPAVSVLFLTFLLNLYGRSIHEKSPFFLPPVFSSTVDSLLLIVQPPDV